MEQNYSSQQSNNKNEEFLKESDINKLSKTIKDLENKIEEYHSLVWSNNIKLDLRSKYIQTKEAEIEKIIKRGEKLYNLYILNKEKIKSKSIKDGIIQELFVEFYTLVTRYTLTKNKSPASY